MVIFEGKMLITEVEDCPAIIGIGEEGRWLYEYYGKVIRIVVETIE